jgi:hypothetical protein
LLRERLENGLPNPPNGVRNEFDALGLVEFMRGPDQPEVALVDEVGQRHALILIFLGDRDDEPEVAAHELVQRLSIPDPNALGQADLFFLRDQRVLADFP